MKIVILNNLCNYYNEIIPFTQKKFFVKYYKIYNIVRLKRLIKKLSKNHNEKIEFKIYNSGSEKFHISKDIQVQSLSEFRMSLNRQDFLEIVKKITKNTRETLHKLLKNLKNSQFYMNDVLIGKLTEHTLIFFLNDIFEEYELFKYILKTEDYDKIILFNYNNYLINLLKPLGLKYKKLYLYADNVLNLINKKFKWFIFHYFLHLLKDSIKSSFCKTRRYLFPFEKHKKIILFFGYKVGKMKAGPFRTVKPIFSSLLDNSIFKPVYFYNFTSHFPLKKFNDTVKLFIKLKRIQKKNQNKMIFNLEYDNYRSDGIFNYYLDLELFHRLIISSIQFYYFLQFIKYYPPSVIVSTTHYNETNRLILNYCKKNNIPTIFVPLAANVNYPELITKSDYKFITTSGKNAREYFLKRGEPTEKIVITGRSAYEKFYQGDINKLDNVKDMFSNRIYDFSDKKFPIIFTSNMQNLDFKSNELILSTIINSLKELDLVDNLLIKLHPLENGIAIKKISQNLDVDPIIIKDYDIFETIKSCKLLFGRKSTTVLEAMMIGTPAIYLDLINLPAKYNKDYQFLVEKSLIKAINQEILTENLKKLIFDEDYYRDYVQVSKDIAKGYSFYDGKNSANELLLNLFYGVTNENRE